MNEREYLQAFGHNLHVGSPKREEIFAELKTHRAETSQPIDNLGNPKELAEKYNRTHLGFFFSFHRLVFFGVAVWIVLEIGLPFFALRLAHTWTWIDVSLNIAPYITIVLLVLGARTIALMHRRWRYMVWWAALLSVLSVLQEFFLVATGYALITSAGPIPWYLDMFWGSLVSSIIVGIGVIALSAGRRLLFPKHPLIDLCSAFVIYFLASLYLIGVLDGFINVSGFAGVEHWFNQTIVADPFITSIIIGLFGASYEGYKILRVQPKKGWGNLPV